MKTKALVIYIGNGYSESTFSYDNTYRYSVDMRDNYDNHHEKIFNPLIRRGYSLDFALLTNKHEKYDEFVEFYDAIPLDYDDINQNDIDALHKFYFWKSDIPPGSFYSGGRFFKLRTQIPEYETYIIIRSDLHFKMSLNELNVDFSKMNWLWPETDFKVFCNDLKDSYIEEMGSDCWCWENYHRVNGNTFNIIPKKFFNAYKNYIWMEHCSFAYMLHDLYPLITINDINIMLGYEKCYVTDMRFGDNPVYTINKKILNVIADVDTRRFGAN